MTHVARMKDTDRKRLAAILGMLGSNSAGERDNAACQAEAFRRKHGLSWDDILVAQRLEPEPPPQPPYQPPPAAAPVVNNHEILSEGRAFWVTVWGIVLGAVFIAIRIAAGP